MGKGHLIRNCGAFQTLMLGEKLITQEKYLLIKMPVFAVSIKCYDSEKQVLIEMPQAIKLGNSTSNFNLIETQESCLVTQTFNIKSFDK